MRGLRTHGLGLGSDTAPSPSTRTPARLASLPVGFIPMAELAITRAPDAAHGVAVCDFTAIFGFLGSDKP